MKLADLRFRLLWARLMGLPLFPAKPLKDGGVLQRRPTEAPLAPKAVYMTAMARPDGPIYRQLGWTDCQALCWHVPGTTTHEVLVALHQQVERLAIHLGSRRVT